MIFVETVEKVENEGEMADGVMSSTCPLAHMSAYPRGQVPPGMGWRLSFSFLGARWG